MSEITHTFTLGAFKCVVLNDGVNQRRASDLFTGVQVEARESALLQLGYDPSALTLSYNILLVQTGDRNVLVDTGIGYDAVPGAGQLRESLRAVGVAPDQIDVIVITHGHADHVGGLTFMEDRLAFPNARYVMAQGEWDFWGSDDALARMAPDRRELYTNTLRWIKDRVELFDGEFEVVPGIRALPAPGHTVAHLALRIESDRAALLHIADAAHHHSQLAFPDWSPVFDYDPQQAARTRRDLFQRAADENLLVMAYHFPFPAVGHIKPAGDPSTGHAFRWQPATDA